VQVSWPQLIPAFTSVSPVKISSIVIVAFECSEKSLGNRKFFCESCSVLQSLTCSNYEIVTKFARLPLISLQVFFYGSKTLLLLAKWMFVHTISN
jgi:hypothetical protein